MGRAPGAVFLAVVLQARVTRATHAELDQGRTSRRRAGRGRGEGSRDPNASAVTRALLAGGADPEAADDHVQTALDEGTKGL